VQVDFTQEFLEEAKLDLAPAGKADCNLLKNVAEADAVNEVRPSCTIYLITN
jgi:hypothetical protein